MRTNWSSNSKARRQAYPEGYDLGDGCEEERESFIKFSERTSIVNHFEMEDGGEDDNGSSDSPKRRKADDPPAFTPLRLLLIAVTFVCTTVILIFVTRWASRDVISKSAGTLMDSSSNTLRYSTLPYYIKDALFEIYKYKYEKEVRLINSDDSCRYIIYRFQCSMRPLTNFWRRIETLSAI
jgi:hypothetical protein